MKTQERNRGIDLLRIICMMTMVTQHLLGHGWILSLLNTASWKYELALALQTECAFGISCFALISGYVGVNSRYRYSALAVQWLKVWLYSVLFTVLAALVFPGTVTREEWLTAFFPTLRQQYWYFTAYAGSFMLAPMIRRAMRGINVKQGTACVSALLIVFCLLGDVFGGDPFYTNAGKATLWLVILYAVGAYFGYFRPHMRAPMAALWAFAGISALLLAGLHSVGWRIGSQVLGRVPGNQSVRGVTTAIAMLLLFSRLNVRRGEKLISVLGAASFGVYLIHDHPLVRRHTISTYAYHLSGLDTLTLIPGILLTAAAIYLLCALVDTARQKLFDSLRVRQRLAAAEQRLIGDLWED